MTEMNSIFEQVLKEANSQELYFREDPDSREAKYLPEDGDPNVNVGASLSINGTTYDFIWHRKKSNENIKHGGFTHYLTRYAYADEKRIIEGQTIGKDVVDLHTSEDYIGLPCSMPVNILDGIEIDDCKYKEDDYPLSVLLLVRQEKDHDGRIRLITCFPTENRKYVKWYAHRYYSRPRIRSDSLDKDDTQAGAQKRESVKLSEQEKFKKSAEVFESVVEEMIEELENNLLKGYHVFLQKLNRLQHT